MRQKFLTSISAETSMKTWIAPQDLLAVSRSRLPAFEAATNSLHNNVYDAHHMFFCACKTQDVIAGRRTNQPSSASYEKQTELSYVMQHGMKHPCCEYSQTALTLTLFTW